MLSIILTLSNAYSAENFFDNAKKKFDEKKLEESKFLFQRNIVFNPKDAKSYIYLAKIFNLQNEEQEERKNLETALILDPTNEDATYMLINIELKKSDYSKVKDLLETFDIICKKLCKKKKEITSTLKDIEPKNES